MLPTLFLDKGDPEKWPTATGRWAWTLPIEFNWLLGIINIRYIYVVEENYADVQLNIHLKEI